MKRNGNAERRMHENRGAEGVEEVDVWGEGIPLPSGEGDWGRGLCSLPEFF